MKGRFWKILAFSAALSISLSTASYAGTWISESGQWKYRNDDGSFAKGWFQDLDSSGIILMPMATCCQIPLRRTDTGWGRTGRG